MVFINYTRKTCAAEKNKEPREELSKPPKSWKEVDEARGTHSMTIIKKIRLSLASLNQEDLYEDDNGKWVDTNRAVYIDNSK
jgi:hypothetical protein